MNVSKKYPIVGLVCIAALAACAHDSEPDAYGTVEAIEVVISSEIGGQLLWVGPDEGDKVANGEVVGVIDTTQLVLERAQLIAQESASQSRAAQASEQIGAIQVQLDIAKRTYDRVQRLRAAQAVTAQQFDQAEGEYRVLVRQLEAAQAQRQTAGQDVTATRARVAQIRERLSKSQVRSPRAGTILASYVKTGELVQPGQPLYRIADLDSLILRAYVSEHQLSSVRLGQSVEVSIDSGKQSRRQILGTVVWISAEAEFTPTPIQTRDERTGLVYAVKIRIPNSDGAVKIGMPADVEFTTETATR